MRLAQIFLLAGVVAAVAAVAATRPVSSEAAATASGMARPATPAVPAGRHFTLVIHGGEGNFRAMPPEDVTAERATLKEAMEAGYRILYRGGSSLDAVEAAIRIMEDSGHTNSGRGGVYTRDGIPELDAAIMDGRTLAAGSVASVKHVKNPISLARLVMEKTPHVMLVGEGAERFAQSQGVPMVTPFYFFNERRWKEYQTKVSGETIKQSSSNPLPDEIHGTVGVVALDSAGNLAAGTSTGGLFYKMPGRVGDSPIIGAGTYANNQSCAVSGTGVGEFYIRNNVAADICARVRYTHVSLADAANEVVMKELVTQKGEGGIIAIDPQGNIAMPYNGDAMMRGVVREDGKMTVDVWAPDASSDVGTASPN
ncbi:MAG: isoaspartyl peptidase/L-asparaginase [Candidatus Acidiferrales bacterium]|jgi:beta-aspartyl-peptidase (threonine type)